MSCRIWYWKNKPFFSALCCKTIDFKNKFQILSLFDEKKLSIKSLGDLIVPNIITSNVQIVANYLNDLKDDENKEDKDKNINNKDLFFEGLTPTMFNTFNSCKVAQCLDQKKCQDLIFTKIKKYIKEPNYYQIKSFIDILATQFKRLNRNIHINANILIESNFDRNIRTTIVENFIKTTKYFTEGAFTKIVKNQNNTQEMLFGKYDENKDINRGIKNLANIDHDVVSFDKIEPSLLFFHEGEGYTFSIITNKERGDAEYDRLFDLKNYQAYREADRQPLPDYKKYEDIDFLQELKNILNLKNPVTEEEKRRKNDPRKSLKAIAGNYVFTADNFVKMALILLRIRANIPVILMGETGCGKTSLLILEGIMIIKII